MSHILCLGTSHTEGGWQGRRETKTHLNAWPGLLEQWLFQQGHDHSVINMGEASYSMDQYAYKLITALDRWPDITHVIVEINTMGKLDVEITQDLHHQSMPHGDSIDARWPWSTRSHRSWPSESRPYRTSVSSQEAVDLYMAWHQLKSLGQELTVDSVSRRMFELSQGIITPEQQNWVHDKLDGITQHMPGTDRAMDILLDHLYFRAVYCDRSDHDVIRYLSQIDHMIHVCDSRDIPIWIIQVHEPWWLEHPVYAESFRARWRDRWLYHDDSMAIKPWVKREFGDQPRDTYMGDAIHFLPTVWQRWVEQQLGPWLIQQIK